MENDESRIWEHLKFMDEKHRIERYTYPLNLTAETRLKTLDYMFHIMCRFKLNYRTFFLCIKLFDRYINTLDDVGNENNSRFFGCVCLWIASKYEEVYPPEVFDFVWMMCDSDRYGSKQFINREMCILKALNYELGTPTLCTFVKQKDIKNKSGLWTLISILCTIMMPIGSLEEQLDVVRTSMACMLSKQPFPDKAIYKIIDAALKLKFKEQLKYICEQKSFQQFFQQTINK